MVGDGSQPARKSFPVDFPGADIDPLAIVHIPSGVHPPVFERQLFLEKPINEQFLVLLIGSEHLIELVGAAGHKHRLRWLAIGLGQIPFHHPLSP